MTAIETASLRRSYGEVTALTDLSLVVEAGELFGFLGPNSAGKTTTIAIPVVEPLHALIFVVLGVAVGTVGIYLYRRSIPGWAERVRNG